MRIRRPVLVLLAALGLLLGAISLPLASPRGERTYQVTMKLWKATVEGVSTLAVTNDPADVIAYAGERVVFVVRNQSPIPEGFAIDAYGIRETLQPNETKRIVIPRVRAGAFTIYCHLHPWSVHQAGTLLVLSR